MQADNEITLTRFRGQNYIPIGGELRELPFGTVVRTLPNGRIVGRVPQTIHNQIPDTRMSPAILLRNPDRTLSAGIVMGGVDGVDESNTYPNPAPNSPLISAAQVTEAVRTQYRNTRPSGVAPLENRTAVRAAVLTYLNSIGRQPNYEELTAFIRENREEVMRIIGRTGGASAA
jgi:hypothetical protein